MVPQRRWILIRIMMKRLVSHRNLALVVAMLFLVQLANPVIILANSDAAADEMTSMDIRLPKDEQELFALFWKVKELITKYHPSEVNPKSLYEGAIAGLLKALNDPYSQYLTQEELNNLSSELEGEYSGIGVTIDVINGNITVIGTFKDSPAERAGIRVGDIILKADDIDLRGKMPKDASEVLRGPAGTAVSITVERPSTGEVLRFRVIREVIAVPSLELRDLGGGVYYIRISQFTSSTGKSFSTVMNYIRQHSGQGLVLDLRDNPGGLLESAIDVARELVPHGPIVELRWRDGRQVIENDRETIPLATVVLINRGTASAAEIVAAALKDRGIGVLVGEPTFGKASVQAVIKLGENLGGMRVTIAEYYTPSGESISGTGLKPDITVIPQSLTLPSKVSYRRPLKHGLIGLDVLALQENLKFLGYDIGQLDGIFGPMTERACQAFCHDHGIPFSGTMGKMEIDTLYLASLDKAKNTPDVVLDRAIEVITHWLNSGNW